LLNQNPEQQARDLIDQKLTASGWKIQNKSSINLHAGNGIAVREYQTDVGPADYVLFVDRKPVGVIEAKRSEEGHRLTVHEEQTEDYASAKLKYLNNEPLPFLFESTGDITRFTDYHDPKPRSREVFSFFRPETFREWRKLDKTLRARLHDLPLLSEEGLRDCQVVAINRLEHSFKQYRPRALVQMATGSGKTFTAITAIYRLLTYAHAKRVLFLVDTKNLGEQAEQEFLAYKPVDSNRKFTELYNVQRLRSSYVATDSHVCISTIQRLYSILKGEELDEQLEETNPGEIKWGKRAPVPVAYNERLPIDFFDFIVIDECHRSIYNLWQQVLEYFDAFLIGLTATPDNRTFGFFHQNIVSEYTHEQAVADGVNVGYNVFEIETEVSKKGGVVWKGEYVDHREKLTRKKMWEQLDEDVAYTNKQLDDKVVNPNQIRLIIKTFKEHLPVIFPDRMNDKGEFEVPKTLVFAKTDSHADDIIQVIREEFAEENRFCKKITYSADDPKGTLAQFRNDYHARIAVTVDMIATGTDVKPLECLLFMRDVKSKNYFDQMKGRGTRTISLDDLKKVSPTAKYTKDHFVIVDAIGVTKSLKTETHSLEKKPGVPLKDLLAAVAVGAKDEELFTTLANRLARLDRQISEKERERFIQKANGKAPSQVVKELLNAFNPDILEGIRARVEKENFEAAPLVKEEKYNQLVSDLQEKAASVFTGELNEYIENVRKAHYQIIDINTQDKITTVGWNKDNVGQAEELVKDFSAWIIQHKEEITALQIYYDQPYRRRTVTYAMIRELLEKLKEDKPLLAPLNVWRAYEQLGNRASQNGSIKNELIALVSLIRHVCHIDGDLVPYDKTVDRNFQKWILKKNAGQHNRFTEEQMAWLRMMKEHIASSFHLEREDLDYAPFDSKGGLGKMWQLFGEKTDEIINELNEELVA
jgi:type I restriction enzyme R subunit